MFWNFETKTDILGLNSDAVNVYINFQIILEKKRDKTLETIQCPKLQPPTL